MNANDKPDATWHPMPDPNKVLDEIAAEIRSRRGDMDVANTIVIAHITNLLATTGRTL